MQLCSTVLICFLNNSVRNYILFYIILMTKLQFKPFNKFNFLFNWVILLVNQDQKELYKR